MDGSSPADTDCFVPYTALASKAGRSVYDPVLGDQLRPMSPGKLLADLSDHWRCPGCDGAKEQFMVLHD